MDFSNKVCGKLDGIFALKSSHKRTNLRFLKNHKPSRNWLELTLFKNKIKHLIKGNTSRKRDKKRISIDNVYIKVDFSY